MFKTIKNRKFYSDNFDVFDKKFLTKELNDLLEYKFNSVEDYEEWIYRTDEFMAIFEESYARCYAASTCETENKKTQEDQHFLNNEIFPIKG